MKPINLKTFMNVNLITILTRRTSFIENFSQAGSTFAAMLDPAARAHLAALPPRDAHKKASQYCHTAYICIYRLREYNVNASSALNYLSYNIC